MLESRMESKVMFNAEACEAVHESMSLARAPSTRRRNRRARRSSRCCPAEAVRAGVQGGAQSDDQCGGLLVGARVRAVGSSAKELAPSMSS